MLALSQSYKELIHLIEAQDKFGIDMYDTSNLINSERGIRVFASYTGEYHIASDALEAVIELHDSQGGCRK